MTMDLRNTKGYIQYHAYYHQQFSSAPEISFAFCHTRSEHILNSKCKDMSGPCDPLCPVGNDAHDRVA